MTDVASDKAQVSELTRGLTELRGRHEAVADIFRALSTSGMRLQPILDRIVETAARLCRADSGFLYLAEDDLLRMRANSGQAEEVVEYERGRPDRAGPHSCTGRVAMTRRPVHIPDVHADPEYTYAGADIAGYRTLLGSRSLSTVNSSASSDLRAQTSSPSKAG